MKMNKKAIEMNKMVTYLLAIGVMVVIFMVIIAMRDSAPKSQKCESEFLKGVCTEGAICPASMHPEPSGLSTLCPKDQICCLP